MKILTNKRANMKQTTTKRNAWSKRPGNRLPPVAKQVDKHLVDALAALFGVDGSDQVQQDTTVKNEQG